MKANSANCSGRLGWLAGASRVRSLTFGLIALLHSNTNAMDSAGPPTKAQDLFQTTKVWTIHLRFTAEQWKAMEPAGAENPMMGPGGRPPMRFGIRGGAGRPGDFGPAPLLAPSFLKGDENHDGKLSREEFRALGEAWFKSWDKAQRGELDYEQLQAGINASLELPQTGPPHRQGPPGPPLQAAEGHRNGLSGASGIDFQYVHADLEFEGQLVPDVAVRYKGNSTFMESRNSIKRSLKIDLNKYVKGQKFAGLTKLNLHNNVTDASWMNEVLSYRLFREAGVPAPRTSYARVFVSVPGQYDKKYFGLYSIVEDVDNHFAKDRFDSSEGALFKPVTSDLFGYQGEDWAAYNHSYDPKTELSTSEKQRMIDFAKLVTSASDADFSARIAEFLDLEEFARFMSVTVWLSTLDSILMMGQNFYVYLHPETHKLQFIPWDLDHSFGQFPMGGTQEQREQLSIQKPWRGNNRFLERVFSVDAFKRLYLATMKDFAKTLFGPERFSQQVDEVAASIRPAVGEESEFKLARFDRVVAGESVERVGFGGGPPPMAGGDSQPRFGPRGFMRPAKPIKSFVTARAQSVNDQLSGKIASTSDSDFNAGPHHDRFFGGGPANHNGFGPAVMLARKCMEAFDLNRDGKLTHEEFSAGFARWFEDWDSDKAGTLSGQELHEGINRTLAPAPAP